MYQEILNIRLMQGPLDHGLKDQRRLRPPEAQIPNDFLNDVILQHSFIQKDEEYISTTGWPGRSCLWHN